MLRSILSELRANPRLRWGLWLTLGILWLYGILVVRDVSRVRQEQYENTVQAISRARAQAAQKEWLGRREPAKLMTVQLESRLWKAGTFGLAQAAFHDWLNQTLAQAAIGRPVVTMTAVDDRGGNSGSASAVGESAAALPEDLWKVKARVEFDFNPQSFLALMTKAASYDKRVGYESLTIRKEPFPRGEMVVVAYFLKQTQSSAAPRDHNRAAASASASRVDPPLQ